MDYIEDRCYDYNRRLYTMVGLWPYQESSIRLRRVSLITFFIVGSTLVLTYLLLISVLKKDSYPTLIQIYLPVVCFTSCYSNLLYNTTTVRAILDRIKSDWKKLANEREVEIMRKYANQSRLCSLVMTYLFSFYGGFLIFPSFRGLHLYASGINNDTQLVLPVRIEFCLENKFRYFAMLSLEYVATSIVGMVGIAYYSMFISFTQHACALFSILALKIDEPFKKGIRDFYSTSSTIKNGEEFDWIVSIVKNYNDAVGFVNLVRSVFRGTYLVEVTLSMLFIFTDFLYFFQILDSMVTTSEVIQNCSYIIGSVLVIYAGFYMGQRLMDHSIKVYTQCCQIPFYVLPMKTRKILLLLLMRSLKPCNYSFNGIMVASFEIFAKLTNASYSLAMVFYKMR